MGFGNLLSHNSVICHMARQRGEREREREREQVLLRLLPTNMLVTCPQIDVMVSLRNDVRVSVTIKGINSTLSVNG